MDRISDTHGQSGNGAWWLGDRGTVPVERPATQPGGPSRVVRTAGSAVTDGNADTIEALAQCVAERVAELVVATRPARLRPRLVGTASVAEMIGVSTDWVRNHAAELGAFRVGDGAKGELRFDPAEVRSALERRRLRPLEPEVVRRPPGPRRSSRNVELLPLPEGGRS